MKLLTIRNQKECLEHLKNIMNAIRKKDDHDLLACIGDVIDLTYKIGGLGALNSLIDSEKTNKNY